MLKIEDGIPAPKRRKSGPKVKYPFAILEKGQSFYVTNNGDEFALHRLNASMRSACYQARKKGLGDFVHQKEGNGVRVWRVE